MNKQFRLGTDSWSKKIWGLQLTPPTFATDGKKYPVIVFFHGLGETGTTEGDLAKLSNQGPVQFASQLTDRFIILALQDQYWSPDIFTVDYILQNDPELKGRINGIAYTGLSAGGQQILDAVTTNQEMANKISVVVPFSAAGIKNPAGIVFAQNAKISVWGFGTSDGVVNGKITDEFVAALNGKKTDYPKGHGGWQEFYNPGWKEKGKSIYDFISDHLGVAGTEQPIDPPALPVVEFSMSISGKSYTVMSDKTWK